ncbi:C-mannosyltransferase dpy-19 isoform X1 [Neodiprion virginianus]|uniref:C-mannosyltransferase dpy-19 isoform X1 n=2 Tax=Neodiprion fabricii TaxID=2872261 RepID=UPI001ED96FE3|nr:C-mannosyltransferase dpy-19 isoform X1 [Neodiprion fabricii]XP_046623950.1 C-mannosyltransferase dpy-19 isoform X1 [Neodiprion virginianus]
MATSKDRKRKNNEKTTKHLSIFYGKTWIIILAIFLAPLHHIHVSTLFENDRHFSHLSEVEREMSFRTEMGMYYSYYKTIVESETFSEGLHKIRHDNLTEYPNTINAIKKFNLFPEVAIGLLYHNFKWLGLIPARLCWQIERGEGLSPVTSCEGLGEPIYFYLEVVWYCASATVAVLFLYAVNLSDSIYGGLIAVALFFYNHNDCTRVQWTPPLRENFAYPILLCQMFNVTAILRQYTKNRKIIWNDIYQDTPSRDMVMCTLLSLLCWQFSQFVFATQLFALLILKWLKIIPNELYLKLCLIHAVPVTIFIFWTQSNLLLCSLYTCMLIASTICSVLSTKLPRTIALPLDVVSTIFGMQFLKFFLLNSDDDAHVFDILLSKFTNYKTFHTMLYTCSSEFDFLGYDTYEAIVKTFLLPTVIMSGVLVLYYWYRCFNTDGFPNCIEMDVAYNVLQTGAFVIMAILIMRLKLFMTPHLCIMASLVTSKRYLEKVEIRNPNIRASLLVLLFASMSYTGVQRLYEEHGFVGEYSNIEQEQLLDWIQKNTPSNAVFAGKMSLMANIMLSTRRPIVNNPYYEDKEMRDRTLKVYEIFSRKDVSTVYETLMEMKVDYVVMEETYCYDAGNPKLGCKITDLWDMVDKRNQRRPSVCPILCRGNSYPFRRVFVNGRYIVLRLERSMSVELKPKITEHYQF